MIISRISSLSSKWIIKLIISTQTTITMIDVSLAKLKTFKLTEKGYTG